MAKRAASTGTGRAGAKGAGSKGVAKRASRTRPDEGGEQQPAPAPIQIPRPRPLSELIGQDRAVATMAAAFASGRLHHAWIFSGPKGVGKFTAALGFAAAALDPTTRVGKDGVPIPDSQSRVQKLLQAGTHPDLHVVVKELAKFSNDSEVRKLKLATFPVDVLKEHLIGPIEISATLNEGGLATKAFIVDEADLMKHAAQNQLLKTLEEPPAGSVLILVTDAEEALLPTVRSRCQRVTFAPLDSASMERWLRSRPDLGLSRDDVEWLSCIGAGSPGEIEHACLRGIPAWRGTLGPLLDRAVAGHYEPALGPAMHKLAEEWAKADVEKNPNASKETANRVAGRIVLRFVAERLRRRLRDESARAAAPLDRLTDAIDAVDEAELMLDANVNGLFVMEAASVGVARVLGHSRVPAR